MLGRALIDTVMVLVGDSEGVVYWVLGMGDRECDTLTVEVKYAVVTRGDGERVTLPEEHPEGVK